MGNIKILHISAKQRVDKIKFYYSSLCAHLRHRIVNITQRFCCSFGSVKTEYVLSKMILCVTSLHVVHYDDNKVFLDWIIAQKHVFYCFTCMFQHNFIRSSYFLRRHCSQRWHQNKLFFPPWKRLLSVNLSRLKFTKILSFIYARVI